MNIRKKSFRDSIDCGSIHGFWLLGWSRMHAPNVPEVECQVSNVIALFGLNVGVATFRKRGSLTHSRAATSCSLLRYRGRAFREDRSLDDREYRGGLLDLFYGVNQSRNVIKLVDDFIPQLR
jgi:hypothetical protein